MPMGIWRSKNERKPTRVTAPQLEQATINLPLCGNGSSLATAAGPSWSPAGVAAEYRACFPAGRAWRRWESSWTGRTPLAAVSSESAPSPTTASSSTGSQYSARFPNGSGPSGITPGCRRRRSCRTGCGPAPGRPTPPGNSGRAGGSTCLGPVPRRTGSTSGRAAGAPVSRSGTRPLR